MLKSKLTTTIKFLLIFSLSLSTMSSYAYFAQMKKIFSRTGKIVTWFPKKIICTPFKISHRSALWALSLVKQRYLQPLPPKKHAKNNIWKIFSLFKKKPIAPTQKLKSPIEKIMGRPLNTKQKLFCATIYTAVYLVTLPIVFGHWLYFVTLLITTISLLLVLCICAIVALIFAAGKGGSAIHEKIRHKRICRTIGNPNLSYYDKLIAAINSGYVDLIKQVLESYQNINMHFPDTGNTPLHTITASTLLTWKRNELIKWMVEEKFADVTAINNTGETPRQSAFYQYQLGRLQNKETAHALLVTQVEQIKQLAKENQDSYQNLLNVKNLIQSHRVPGYTKMLVLPKIIELLKENQNFYTDDEIAYFYQQIEFNLPFLEEEQFRPAVEYARIRNIKDKNDNFVFEGEINASPTKLSNTLEKTPQLYRINKETLKKLLRKENIEFPSEKAKNKTVQKTAEYFKALYNAREKRNKKKFLDLANPLIVARELGKIVPENKGLDQVNQNVSLPQEVVGIIMGYAGGDFGDKLLI